MRLRCTLVMSAMTVLAACAGSGAADTSATDTAAMAAAAVAPAPTVYTITAKDFSFDAPDTITAGMVTLRLVNQGPELHHVQLLKLDAGHTAAEFAEGLKRMKPSDPPPPWIHELAGPNSPVPGGEQSVTQELSAGNYMLVCFIPSPDQIPHIMKGMSKALTVAPATAATAVAPTSDITVKMTDYAWEVTPAISAGKHIIRLENAAEQPHIAHGMITQFAVK